MSEQRDKLALAIEALQAFASGNDFFGWHGKYAGAIAKARLALGGVSDETPAAIDARYIACVEAELRETTAELESLRRAVKESNECATITARAAELHDELKPADACKAVKP